MTEKISAAASLDVITVQIKMKLVENQVLTKSFNRNINHNSIEIGQWLTQAKKIVPYKEWQIWLDANFGMTKQAAGNYIRVAEMFANLKNVFQVEDFNFAALIELTKIPASEVEKFLAKNPNAKNLSVRNLREELKKIKGAPSSKTAPLIIDIDVEITPAPDKVLKLPPPQFVIVPASLVEAALEARIEIAMNFSRTLRPADTEILLTRLNGSAINKYSAVAAEIIFAAPMEFLRSDGVTKKLASVIWYFGAVAQVFNQHFSQFGKAFYPAKKARYSSGQNDKPINNCGEIIPFKGGKFNG